MSKEARMTQLLYGDIAPRMLIWIRVMNSDVDASWPRWWHACVPGRNKDKLGNISLLFQRSTAPQTWVRRGPDFCCAGRIPKHIQFFHFEMLEWCFWKTCELHFICKPMTTSYDNHYHNPLTTVAHKACNCQVHLNSHVGAAEHYERLNTFGKGRLMT